jgi:hypothetical protein
MSMLGPLGSGAPSIWKLSGHLKAAAASLVILTISLLSASADTAPEHVVLWNLPPKDSQAYRSLREIAGTPDSEVLVKTGAEMWTVAPGRTHALRQACNVLVVQVAELGDHPDELVADIRARMDADKPMPPAMADVPFLQRAMQSPAVTSVTIMMLKPPALVEYALTRRDKPADGKEAVVHTSQGDVAIYLGGGIKVRARRRHMETRGDTIFWYGTDEGTGLPVSLMWASDGRISGTFTHGDKEYVIRNISGRLHAVVAMDRGKLPPEHPPPPSLRPRTELPAEGPDMRGRPDRGNEDRRNLEDAIDGTQAHAQLILRELDFAASGEAVQLSAPATPVVIDVLFLYTRAAAGYYQDIHRELIMLAVEQTNQSFRSSGIANVRIEPAGSRSVDYDERDGAGLFEHLWHLADRGDGFLDEIHQMRNESRADVVVLILAGQDACGLATRVKAEADEAFVAVDQMCALTTYSVAHEIGHLIGARHDRAVDSISRPFPFGHGYVNGEKWRTIMAYKGSCKDCPRLPLWSNPHIRVAREPAGDAMAYDARVIAEYAARVAAFR